MLGSALSWQMAKWFSRVQTELERQCGARWDKQASACTGHHLDQHPGHGVPYRFTVNHNSCAGGSLRKGSHEERTRRGHPYLNRKDDPRLKRTGFGFGLGSSKSLKKAWCSTHIFQKDLQKSRPAIRNSKVSWYEL